MVRRLFHVKSFPNKCSPGRTRRPETSSSLVHTTTCVHSDRTLRQLTIYQWSGSTHLQRSAEGFVGRVRIPCGSRLLYKWIVDGQWTCDDLYPRESDSAGNMNNLYIAPLKPILQQGATAAFTDEVPPCSLHTVTSSLLT
jgi:hypothetical protein